MILLRPINNLFDKIHQEKSLYERQSANIIFVILKIIEQSHRNSIDKVILIFYIFFPYVNFVFSTS
jgi:hypothetical protein